MKELLRRLFRRPVLAIEILIATLLISLLALAMPLYVIQILNRYISYGFHGTLLTLTSGMLIAIFLQLCFRMIRTKMATAVNQSPNDDLSKEVLNIVARSKAESLDQFSKPRVQEALNNVQTIQTTYDAQNMNAVIDAPFSLLFVAAVYLLSPVLAFVSLIGIFAGLFFGWLGIRKSGQNAEQMLRENSGHRNLNYSAVNAMESVRAFSALPFLEKQWKGQLEKIGNLRDKMADTKELSQSLTMSGNILTSVFIYAVGATIVVQGDLTVGALIGANILAARAYQNITRLVQVSALLRRSKQSFKEIALLRQLPQEPAEGSALRVYNGHIEFKDVGFAYPGSSHPVFESLDLLIKPGEALAVFGGNGTGKTTMAKLLTGLLEPRRGSILADNVNVQQLAFPWWRKQIIYMPQEPTFLNGTIRENITLLNPDLEEEILNRILRMSDLKRFLDMTPDGLDAGLTENAKSLPLGIRRRLSLARGLVSDGQLVILDEPTDAMDQQGAQAIYRIMNELIKAKKTIIVFSNDPKILKGASQILNMNVKPKPELKTQAKTSINALAGNGGRPS